ncbi:YihY/virulence factor BrkB family protein [Pseudosulfitobacter koreensis]|uniref:YihY/virulence factor BrkB family protein n=1 Tax=Pseudosulfitobacter koreensis TaxID=2968472 RepID=A0ABT1Z0T8_9RHOB|nr:YihY/virulence factor BrkB family protein [Pseudosulfitobacter koreense]MCR8826701.1 YihY/virulence factor BrkB family protein [Pseudosulfitobacter koreense]
MTRGRDAQTPKEIPAKGWKDILYRVKDEIAADHLSLIAAGVAFYALLALFPAITALMALAGLLVEPSQITGQIESLAAVMPQEAATIILDQAVAVTGSEESGLGWAFALGLGLALYSASKGMSSLMEGLNVVYDEEEKRGFVKRTMWTLGLTLLLIVGLICGLTAALALPVIISVFGLPVWLENLLAYGRWVLLAALSITGLAVLYRFGPSRDNARWKWLTPGTMIACAMWLLASVGFSIYVSNFGSYNETFGSMAGAIILLMWLWISAFIILIGAEFNSEMEAQTSVDSTTGEPQPAGERGARKADKLGEAQV